MKKILLIVPAFLVVGFVVGTVSAPVLANAQESVEVVQGEETVVEPAGGEDELTAEERQTMLEEITTQLEEVEREALRLSLLVMRLELEEQALALEQQLQQALTQGGAGVAAAMPVPGSNVPEMVAEETAVAEETGPSQFSEVPVGQTDLGVEESVNAFPSEGEVQGEEEEEGKGFLAGFGPLANLGAPELAALAILVFLVAFTLLRRLRRGRTVRPSSPQNILPASQPLPQSPQGMLQEGREDLKEKIAWE